MPNTETVRALVSAFNVHNYARNTVKTNFMLQSDGKKNYIVVSFDKSMDTYQCRRYLDSIKRKIIREFYGIEESNDAEILDTAKLIFDVNSFPFDISDRDWSWDKQHGFKFVTPVDKGVIFNLKSHLAASLAKDVIEGMPTCNIRSSDRKGYLWHGKFLDKESRKKFESEFLSRMRERYENVPKKLLEVKGNSVYIKDVFDDARFIDSVTRYKAWLVGMYLGVDSSANHKVKLFKDMIIESIGQSTGVTIYGFVCASPLGKEEASILIPLVLDCEEKRILTNEEALELNCTFNCAVFYDLYGRTQGKLSINESSGMYSINFSNPYISHCVITKIIESSVINKDHELSIDPELRFQALSPAQSPFNSPTHAGQSGLRTPPNQRKADTDSGYDSNSPPKPKDSGSSSGGPSSGLTQLSSPTQEFPTRSQDGALEDSSRRESEQGSETEKEGLLLHNHVNLAGTSKGFPPLPQLNFIAVSDGVSGPSKSGGNLGAAAASGSIPGSSLWSQSGASSSRGAGKNMPTGSSSWCLPPSTSSLTTRNDPISSNFGIFADPPEDTENTCSMKPEKQQVTDESDRKSSDECSEAQSQESEPPKKDSYNLFYSERKSSSDNESSFFRKNSSKRSSKSSGTSTTSSSTSSTSEKTCSQKPSILDRAKNLFSPKKNKRSPQEFTDVTVVESSSGLNLQEPLTNSEREKLYENLRSEMKKKLNSKSFFPEYERLLYLLFVNKRELHLLLSSSREVEQVCSILPLEEKKQLYPNLSLEARKGLLFKFFGDEQEISRNVSTSSGDSGISIPSRLSSSSQRSTNSASSNFSNTSVFFNENFQDENVQIKTDLSAIKVEQNLQSKNKEIV